MTTQVELSLPTGGQRTYRIGDRVEVLPGCPECSSGCRGTIANIVDGYSLVIQPDGQVECLRPIPADSLYLSPFLGAVIAV